MRCAIGLKHLVKLDLRGCEGITYRSLVHLSKIALNLEELNLSNTRGLRAIGDLGNFIDAPLIFNKLRFLNLGGCINLTKLLIRAPNLHYLNVENCSLLTDQMLDGVIEVSKILQKLVVEGSALIGERILREQFPNFPPSYWKGVKKKGWYHKNFREQGERINIWKE